jgi:excisionase family DNA binding protein
MITIPTLDQLSADRLRGMPLEALAGLLARCHAVEGIIADALLVAASVMKNHEPAPEPAAAKLLDSNDENLSVDQIAAELKVQPSTVYELVRSGRLESFRCGKYIRIRRFALQRYITKHSRIDSRVSNMLSRSRDRGRSKAPSGTTRAHANGASRTAGSASDDSEPLGAELCSDPGTGGAAS